MSMTLDALVDAATGAVATVAPDMGIYIAAGAVISLAVWLFRRAVKAAR